MLRTRIISALIGLPLLLWLLALGPTWLLITFFTIFVVVSTYEASSMLIPKLEEVFGKAPITKNTKLYNVSFCVLICTSVFIFSTTNSLVAGRGVLICSLLFSLLVGCFSSMNNDQAVGRSLGYILCICYGCLPWLAFWDLYLMGENARFLILLLAIVWSGDTGAYFGGRFFGKHKLAPTMSPKKTWEGAIAGVLSSLLAGCLCNLFWNFSLGSHVLIFITSLVGAIAGQLGDLVESSLKRFSGAKDSGQLIPGHGGFLDRVDGLLFAAPLIWFLLYTFN